MCLVSYKVNLRTAEIRDGDWRVLQQVVAARLHYVDNECRRKKMRVEPWKILILELMLIFQRNMPQTSYDFDFWLKLALLSIFGMLLALFKKDVLATFSFCWRTYATHNIPYIPPQRSGIPDPVSNYATEKVYYTEKLCQEKLSVVSIHLQLLMFYGEKFCKRPLSTWKQ